MTTEAAAYYSEEHGCWYVPVLSEVMDAETVKAEPCRVELRDGQLWITLLETDHPDPMPTGAG